MEETFRRGEKRNYAGRITWKEPNVGKESCLSMLPMLASDSFSSFNILTVIYRHRWSVGSMMILQWGLLDKGLIYLCSAKWEYRITPVWRDLCFDFKSDLQPCFLSADAPSGRLMSTELAMDNSSFTSRGDHRIADMDSPYERYNFLPWLRLRCFLKQHRTFLLPCSSFLKKLCIKLRKQQMLSKTFQQFIYKRNWNAFINLGNTLRIKDSPLIGSSIRY